jgi:hypothetical protein
MDRRSAMAVIAASGVVMFLPSVTRAETLWRKKLALHVGVDVGDDRKRALEDCKERIQACLVMLLKSDGVVGLDLEEDVQDDLRHNIKIDFMGRSFASPWLGKPSDTYVLTEAIVQKRVHRDGRELVVERLGGPHPGAEFLEGGRMGVFLRAMDLRISRHIREVTEPLDTSRLRDVSIHEASTVEYLAQRMRQWNDLREAQWNDLREAAFRDLAGIKITVPVVCRKG